MPTDTAPPPAWLNRYLVASRRYTLLVLTVYFVIAHLDRQVLAITLAPIGREFALNDVQLGLLSGLAFALFFSTLGLPLALAATRYNRRNLIAITIALWSAMTMLSGLAQSYWQLLATRMGVGVGEAGALPASHAVISDRYGPGERASAMGVFMSGANIGVAIALLGGGLIAQHYGWRAALLLAGVPGLLLAAVIRLTVPEPTQRLGAGEAPPVPGVALLRQTAATIWHAAPMRLMFLATVLNTVTTFGMVAWLPTFLVREHGMSLSAVGLYLAAAIGVAGAMGTMFAGRLADRLAMRNAGWIAWVPCLLLLIAKPFAIAGLLATGKAGALLLLLVPCTLGAAYIAPTIAVLHGRLNLKQRPIGSALLLFGMNLIGMGLGPLIVGAVSEAWGGEGAGLGAGLIAVQFAGIVGIVVFALAGVAMERTSDAGDPVAEESGVVEQG
ncbi:spinster family MFS transporter [Methyloceanibacter methanicus]|uniref:spinster family MFS transporter n=1 Tax=Methyloceanibacter methanicus TaxID=1774968 RepID=UPI0009F4B633|nr:MFS transporter [Methyloceanibacter methanicus]